MLYLQFCLKITSRGQKYPGFLLNCTKISLTVSCWKFRRSTLCVDFKTESASVLQTRGKKIKFYIYLANEEMGAATFNSR